MVVYVLGLSIFAQGTSEFMLSGLLPQIAGDLGVSIPDAGLLVSAFAVGMVVGAPLLAVLTLRWPRRTALLAFLVVFAADQVAGALAPGYGALFATRVVGALAYAGFWAVAAATAVELVPSDSRARALAVVVGGLAVANVVGVPAGALLGQHAGWRAAFWAVAVLCVLATIGLLFTLRSATGRTEQPRAIAGELRALGRPRIWVAYGTTALTQGALFCTFSYLAALLTRAGGLAEGWVPAVLTLFGVGAVIGLTVGGRFADSRPTATLTAGLAAMVAVCVTLAFTAHQAVVTVVVTAALGLVGFAVNPALNARVFSLAAEAPTLAGAVSTAAFNVGNTVGPWLGGVAIGAGWGYPSVAVVSAVLGAGALATAAVSVTLDRRAGAGRTSRTVAGSVPERRPETAAR
nr:Cmx/CmrA family chloramphenicol efflux MFS transporter [Streptomyces sp. SID5468]